jgi:drug/metabolite transporter (DMT)-like permease
MESKQFKWGYLSILSLIWGSSFILIKKGLIGLSALQLGSLRLIFSAIFLVFIGYKSVLSLSKSQWKYVALTALFGTFIPAYLFALAETEIDSSTTAILNSLTPLNTLILGILAFRIPFKRNQFFGICIGFLGSVLLVFNGAFNHPEQNYYYALLVVAASICYATNVNLVKKFLPTLSPLSITTGNFLVLLTPATLLLYFSGFFDIISAPEVQISMGYIAILGIVGTGIANILFFKLIQISSPVFATSVTYLIPIVAFFWGLLDHEILTPIQFIGAFIILLGVYLSSKK